MANKKIKNLFRYRKIPQLAAHLPAEKRKNLLKKLMALQSAIYDLDAYLESHWKLKKKKLDKLWEKIYSNLRSWGYDEEQIDGLTHSIQRYQLHEMQIRDGKLPTRLDTEYYYYYKSCDVRLIRQIILDRAPEMLKHLSVTDWRYYDLITEINDDISDFYEDLDAINGNLFLFMIWQEGLKPTVRFFNDLLDSLFIKSLQRNHDSQDEHIVRIKDQTFKRYVQTRTLLKKMYKKIRKKGFPQDSKLIKRLEKLNIHEPNIS